MGNPSFALSLVPGPGPGHKRPGLGQQGRVNGVDQDDLLQIGEQGHELALDQGLVGHGGGGTAGALAPHPQPENTVLVAHQCHVPIVGAQGGADQCLQKLFQRCSHRDLLLTLGVGRSVLFHMGDALGQLFLPLNVPLAGDHNPLGLGRTGPVEGLGAVAHGAGTQGEVFDEAENPHAVFRGGAGAVLHVFGLYRSTLAAPRLAGGY